MAPSSSDSNSRSNAPPSKLTRRKFLGVAGAAVAGGSTASLAAAPAIGGTASRPRELTADVVVAGSGMGGITAAVRAARQGADVILLEKDGEPGGTMRESEGIVWTYGSYESMRNDCPGGDPDLQRTLHETLSTAMDFYREIGTHPPDAGITIDPPDFTSRMIADLERHGGRLLVETPFRELITNGRDEVVGATAEGPDGPVRIRASAVVLATGGFAGNAALVNQHITRHFGSLRQRNIGFARADSPITGDGLWAASRIGAAPSAGGFDAFYGHVLPARPARFSHPLADHSIYHGQWAVALNLRGMRFADESRGRKSGIELTRVAEELIAQEIARQPEATAIYVWDHPVDRQYASADSGLGGLDKFAAYRDAGAPVARAETLADLADQIEGWGRGIPGRTALRTLEEFNEAARNGRTPELPVPKESATHAAPIAEPPFYAVLGTTGISGTMGGLRANPRGQILSRTGRPIPGLYAAGVDIGNIADYVYLGFLGYGAVFGYISGANAAAEPRREA